MAAKKGTRRTTTTTVEEPELGAEAEELDPFERARMEFSGEPGVKLTVYRYDDGETAYLKRIPYDPDTVDEEWVRKKWGPGSYQLRFTDERHTKYWSKIVTIAADQAAPAPGFPAGAAYAPSPSSAETQLLDTLRRQNEILLQSILARLNAPAPAASGGDGSAMVTLIQGLSNQNTELLRASLNRPDVSATILQVLERGMSIAAEHQLDQEGGWMAQAARIARELLPALTEMSRARQATGPGAVVAPAPGTAIPTVPALPAGNPAGAPAPTSSPSSGSPVNGQATAGGGIDLDELVRNFAPSILEAIEKGARPEDVADSILGYIPPALYDVFRDLTPDRAIRVSPALSQHRPYVQELVAALRSGADDDEEEGEAS